MEPSEMKGFTLIELMVVVAVIGVLIAVAIPQYKNYVIRTNSSASIEAIRTIQLAVSEYSVLNRALPPNNIELPGLAIKGTDLEESNTCKGIVQKVTMDEDAILTITFYSKRSGEEDSVKPDSNCMQNAREAVPGALSGKTIVVTPKINATGAVKWEIDKEASSVPENYLPTI